MPFTVSELARQIDGQVEGNGAVVLSGFAPADSARAGDLTFAENEAYFEQALRSDASAILVDGEWKSDRRVLIRVASARIAFAKVLPLFFPEPQFEPGIHPTAIVDAAAEVDPTAHVGPYCVVGAGARLGARCGLEGLDHVGAGCALAEDCRLFPRVTLYPGSRLGRRVRVHSGAVVGADGFGYVLDNGVHRKVPQIGRVEVEDDVEIGANVAIDRGALGVTRIGQGTKIDNLVQLGHNVQVGKHCLLVSQAGIAGSTQLGDYVTLAGQVGLAGHLKLGDRVTVAAKAGVMNDIPDGQQWLGIPAQPNRDTKRQFVAIRKLPDLLKRVAELEKRVEALSKPST
jgi:UDP-3-O-[3-hydroxymyristoyl] glucosamine N-acyltransferase